MLKQEFHRILFKSKSDSTRSLLNTVFPYITLKRGRKNDPKINVQPQIKEDIRKAKEITWANVSPGSVIVSRPNIGS